ncbi:hypothetical protein I317_05871 [Kwoniella heveanensis CBS 569]|nr:hypothetical protein I317_05871 [Kwoniella heveanensis CBS 569]
MSDSRLAFLRQTTPASPESEEQKTSFISCSFQHRAAGAEGEVELKFWPARARSGRQDGVPPKRLIVFILGNPGLLGYYPPFLNHLHSLLPDNHAILATSHIGHSTMIPPPPAPLDLPQQLESKVELVQSIRRYLDEWASETDSNPKICLMGHSVGAWLLVEVMKRLNRTTPSSEAGYLLFPTLGWIANTWNGWTLWPIFHRPVKPLLPLLSPLIRPILPYTSLPETSLALVRDPKVIEHVLHLSRSEMDLIRGPDIEWFKSQNDTQADHRRSDDSSTTTGDKGLYGVWAGGSMDGWVGKDGPIVQEALGGLEGGRVKVLDGVPHAFCLTHENSERVAQAIAAWINPSSSSTSESKPTGQPETEPIGANVMPM